MSTDLVKFDEVRAEIAEYKAENANLVFDYEDLAGNKDARSHIFKLRKVKTKIAAIHKDVKAAALTFCKAVDDRKRTLTADIEEMIETHDAPLKAIEQRIEQERLAKIQAEDDAKRAEEERQRKEMEAREAEVARKEAEIKAKEDAIVAAEEKQRLEAERIEREKRIAEEAAEKARKEAEAKAKAEEATRLANEAVEKAERERLAKEERKRVEDKNHRMLIETSIHNQLHEIIDDYDITTVVLDAIRDGKIDNVTINY